MMDGPPVLPVYNDSIYSIKCVCVCACACVCVRVRVCACVQLSPGGTLLVKAVSRSDSGTQTDTHLLEANLVTTYQWNEWELRRLALKLVRLSVRLSVRPSSTHTSQVHWERTAKRCFREPLGGPQQRSEPVSGAGRWALAQQVSSFHPLLINPFFSSRFRFFPPHNGTVV